MGQKQGKGARVRSWLLRGRLCPLFPAVSLLLVFPSSSAPHLRHPTAQHPVSSFTPASSRPPPSGFRTTTAHSPAELPAGWGRSTRTREQLPTPGLRLRKALSCCTCRQEEAGVTSCAHLDSNQAFLPGVDPRQIDVFQGLPTEPKINPIWGHGKLEGHSLVRFRHPGGWLAPGRGAEGRSGGLRPTPPPSRTYLRPAPAPSLLAAAPPAPQARHHPDPSPANGREPLLPPSGQDPPLRCRAQVGGGFKAFKTSGSRRAVKGGVGRCPRKPCCPE